MARTRRRWQAQTSENDSRVDRTATYAMLNVTSVSRAFTKPNRLGPVVLLAIGGLVVLTNFSGKFEIGPFMIGMVLAGVGALVWKLQKTKYHLRIASASGEANAIMSVNADQIDK